MILLAAVLVGALAGFAIARLRRRSWMVPSLRGLWLIAAASILQIIIAYLPTSRSWLPDEVAALALVLSLILLLVFCWLNRRVKGVWLLASGLTMNLLVICLNGGFMPISPDTASRIFPPDVMAKFQSGDRFSYKDILLDPGQTRLGWLADIFLPPRSFPYQFAFSVGDLLVAGGVVWLLVAPALAAGNAPSTA
jgi:hypothetical protein